MPAPTRAAVWVPVFGSVIGVVSPTVAGGAVVGVGVGISGAAVFFVGWFGIGVLGRWILSRLVAGWAVITRRGFVARRSRRRFRILRLFVRRLFARWVLTIVSGRLGDRVGSVVSVSPSAGSTPGSGSSLPVGSSPSVGSTTPSAGGCVTAGASPVGSSHLSALLRLVRGRRRWRADTAPSGSGHRILTPQVVHGESCRWRRWTRFANPVGPDADARSRLLPVHRWHRPGAGRSASHRARGPTTPRADHRPLARPGRRPRLHQQVPERRQPRPARRRPLPRWRFPPNSDVRFDEGSTNASPPIGSCRRPMRVNP